MDIKQRLRDVIDGKGHLRFPALDLGELCRAALAEIERLEQGKTMRDIIATQCMAAQLSSDYNSSRVYDMNAMAADAVAAADALLKKLHAR